MQRNKRNMERVPKERSCAEAREQKIENVRKRIRRMKTEFRKLLEEAIVVRVCWQSEREKARVLKCFAWAKLSLATEGLSHALSPFQFLNPNNYNFRVLSLRRPLADLFCHFSFLPYPPYQEIWIPAKPRKWGKKHFISIC